MPLDLRPMRVRRAMPSDSEQKSVEPLGPLPRIFRLHCQRAVALPAHCHGLQRAQHFSQALPHLGNASFSVHPAACNGAAR